MLPAFAGGWSGALALRRSSLRVFAWTISSRNLRGVLVAKGGGCGPLKDMWLGIRRIAGAGIQFGVEFQLQAQNGGRPVLCALQLALIICSPN